VKRILHFAQDSDTSGFFPQLAVWYDRSKYRMYFGTLNPTAPWLREHMEKNGVQVFSCDAKSRAGYPLAILRLARFLRREKIDIVHVHLFDPSFVGLLAAALARTRVRITTRHYSDYHTRIDKKWHVMIDQMYTALSDLVVGVSNHTAEHLIEVEHAPRRKVAVVLNGIDFARVKASSDARERIRRELGTEDAHQLLIAARLHPEKGYEHLFDAMLQVRQRLTRPVRLFIAGTGPLEPMFRQQVAVRGLDDAVTFLGFRKDLPDLMVASDLFVLPSVAEAFGLVLAEALHLGTPVIASRVGGIPEIVDDGVDGLLVPPADPRALADAIVSLLGDEDRRRTMAGAGRAKVERRFRFEDMVHAYEQLYAKIGSAHA
jgi:glycosyltransferase involved in cell wall biosynthesis